LKKAANKNIRRRTFALRISVVGQLLCLCLCVTAAQASFAASPLLHKQAPEFVRLDLQNRKLDLRAYRGKVVLLDFWATWCAPCMAEMPRFMAWQKQYGASGLQVIGISMDDDPAPVRKLYEKLKLNYPVVMGDERLGELYGGVMGLPVTFLLDRNGRIQEQFTGETDLNAMEGKLKALLHP